MSAADIACYAAKDAGRNRIHVYQADGVSDRHREMKWVARVTRAADDNRLELFFQPIVSLGSSGSRGFQDRKSTRLNSSHSQISYAVFCLKKKKKQTHNKTSTDTTISIAPSTIFTMTIL